MYRTYIKKPDETIEHRKHADPYDALAHYRKLAACRIDGPGAAVLTEGATIKKRTRIDAECLDECRVEIDEATVIGRDDEITGGADMRRMREAAGLTQAALAEAVGLTPVTICRMEGGSRRITRMAEIAIRAVCDEAHRAGDPAEFDEPE